MTDPTADIVLRTLLAALWVTSAGHKLFDLRTFRARLTEYQLVPVPLAGLIAAGVPLVEGAIAIAFWVPGGRVVALIGSAALLVSYAAAMGINLLRGRRDLACGCGGAERPVSWALVLRNVLVATVCVAMQAPVATRAGSWVDAVTVVGASISLSLAWLAVDGVLALEPRRAALREVG